VSGPSADASGIGLDERGRVERPDPVLGSAGSTLRDGPRPVSRDAAPGWRRHPCRPAGRPCPIGPERAAARWGRPGPAPRAARSGEGSGRGHARRRDRGGSGTRRGFPRRWRRRRPSLDWHPAAPRL